jgi:hypothetical protein
MRDLKSFMNFEESLKSQLDEEDMIKSEINQVFEKMINDYHNMKYKGVYKNVLD